MSLVAGSVETDSSYQPLLGAFKVRLRFLKRIEQEATAMERSAAVMADGSYRLEIDTDARTDVAASVSLLGPTSETLYGSLLADLLGEEGKLKPIKLKGKAPQIRLSALPANATQPLRRVALRVFVADGGVLTGKPGARVYVQISGRAKRTDAITPIASGMTDANGYLSLLVPNQPFDKLVARLGTGTNTTETEIARAADGTPPDRIILTASEAGTSAQDCNCDLMPPRLPDATELAENTDVYSVDLGAGCEDFTLPNRTLEEFDFYKIVRTTDPDIRGLTLPDTVSAAVADTQVLKIAFDQKTLSQQLRTLDFAAPTGANSDPDMGATIGTAMQPTRDVTGTAMTRSMLRGSARQPVPETPTPTNGSRQLHDVLPAYLDVRPLEASGTVTAAQWRERTDEKITETALKSALAKIPAKALQQALQDPDGFTPIHLMTLERRASMDALRCYLKARQKKFAGRAELTEDNPVDWDETPEFYQATSIAHGHLLHFKQEWKADGYSLGEVVKSIPLAPGQKKQIAVLDWDREDRASRTEAREASESLQAFVSRDRDINEIANASFRESIKGGSQATTGAVGGGIGFAIGPLVIGGGGGSAWSSSTAWNDGSRTLTGETLNQLRDDISQGVSAVRNQRSTVIETVGQSERVTATTEVIANYNRCHATTVLYFEVLRHFAVQERLAGVQECLFVPLQMTLFDDAKVLRWREILTDTCRKGALRSGFDSIWRLSSPETTPPDRAFADDPIEEMSGRLFVRVSIARPKDPDDASRAVLEQTEWRFFGIVLRVNPEVVYEQYRRNEQKRDQIFRSEIAPEVARLFLESLRVVLIDRDGNQHDAGFDPTLLSRYVEGGLMEIALNDAGGGPRLTRREIVGVEIRTDFQLPEFSRVIVERASIQYRTERFNHVLYRNDRVLDDVLAGDPAFLSTSALSRAEERNQLKEDRERRRKLLRHLNDNIEYYHRMIWWRMDAARRFMLLDGFEAPNAGGRSVSSVVENRLIGIVGNALVMPVAPGFQLDPALKQVLKKDEDPLKALNTLYDMAPSTPRRHSVPTKGVFAEAMNGKCNSCEVIEEDRFWRWKDFPLPDSPPAIGEVSTESRFAGPGSLAPTGFPDALVKFQTIPTAPDPTGMSAALNLLGKDVFKDLTGLTQNQKNAMAALTTAMGTSEAFAGEAFKLALAQDAARNMDRTIGQIEEAKKAGLLTDEEASQATRDALLRTLGEDGTQTKDVTELPGVKEALEQLGTAPAGSASVTRSSGENSETVAVTKEDASALTIGTKSTPEVRDIEALKGLSNGLWTKTPLIIDAVTETTPNTYTYSKQAGVRSEATLRINNRQIVFISGNPVVLDGFESAIQSKLLRLDPADATKFELRVNARVGYPADPKDKAKIAAPAVAGTKYPLVIILHGQTPPPWKPSGAPTATGKKFTAVVGGTSMSLDVYTQTLTSDKNHAGYDYLQTFLAETGRQMITVSVETNMANMVNSMVEMRAQIVLDVLTALETFAGDSKNFFYKKIDFQNIGILGHSRGGEAAVLIDKLTRGNPKYGIKAICSLAPSDWLGTTAAALSVPFGASSSYLVVFGGLDHDIHGARSAGKQDPVGTGFRLYDRSAAHKAMVFAPFACHNRFNTNWPQTTEAGFSTPATALTDIKHQSLAKEYIGGFFDLVLNKDKRLESLFNNTQKNAAGTGVAIQWRFGSKIEDIDECDAPLTSRTVTGASGPPVAFAPTLTPGTASAGKRDFHVPHHDVAIVFAPVTAGGTNPKFEEKLTDGTNAFKDISAFDAITFRLGQLYPIADQTAIDNLQPPKFTVSLTDDAGVVHSMDSTEIYKDLANGWAKPALKKMGGVNATQMFLQTIPINFSRMWENNLGPVPLPLDYTKVASIAIEFDATAGTPELWFDSLTLIKK